MSDRTLEFAPSARERLIQSAARMQRRRRRVNALALSRSLAAMAFGLLWLVWILVTTVQLGIGALWTELFTASTPPPNTEGGGLANAIVGSLELAVTFTLIGTLLGVMAGVYLAEYGRRSWLASITRFLNDILLSAPSIVIGLFVYAFMVGPMGHFSGWAGIAALTLLQLPIIIRTTKNMLSLVPDALREASAALGTPKSRMIRAITLKASVAGIVTGVLLAVARISGETAPLLFTALSAAAPILLDTDLG